jgi:hypothetical protein
VKKKRGEKIRRRQSTDRRPEPTHGDAVVDPPPLVRKWVDKSPTAADNIEAEEQKARTTNTGEGVETATIAGGAPKQPNPPDNSIRIHTGITEDEPPPRKPDRHHCRGTKDHM